MSIEKMIHCYNLYCRTHCLEDPRYYKGAQRRETWLKRCAERQGVRIKATGYLIMIHNGVYYQIPLYGLRRRMVLLDEA